MKDSFKTGLNFGVTSGVITTLGLIIGLALGSGSQVIVIGGIITLALADSLSDAMGIHISEESKTMSKKSVRESTYVTFIFKAISALSFLIPVLLFPLTTALFISIGWGILLITLLSIKIARDKGEKALHIVIEHLAILIIVVILTYFVGKGIARYVGG